LLSFTFHKNLGLGGGERAYREREKEYRGNGRGEDRGK